MTLVMNKRFRENWVFLVLNFLLLLGSTSIALAEGPAGTPANNPPAGGPPQPGGIMAFMPFILMFGVLYFLVLRPQQKKMKEQQEMISALKQGDEIITNSGILGKVTGITDKVVTVEVADNVRVKMMKSQVSQVVKGSIKDLSP